MRALLEVVTDATEPNRSDVHTVKLSPRGSQRCLTFAETHASLLAREAWLDTITIYVFDETDGLVATWTCDSAARYIAP